jgi:hypothetical protein
LRPVRSALGILLIALALGVAPGPPRPAPTEHVVGPDAEKRLKDGRRAWIEELHRAAPGVDWRAVERENGLARTAARARAARVAERVARADGGASDGERASPWLEIGSRNLAGRMHAAALSADGDSLYAGSSRGGVWKADLEGRGWRPISDNLWGGAHGLAVAAGPPETITRITDDGLVHYTEDGGATWHLPAGNVTNFEQGIRVLADRANPSRVYLLGQKPGAIGGDVWKLYVSEDRGKSYELIRNPLTKRSDVWIDRRVGGRLWLLEDDTLLHTDDAGATWTAAGSLPVSGLEDVVLAGSEAGAPTFWAAARTGGTWDLYRSIDAGATWAWRHAIHDFWKTLEGSIVDPDLVLFGGVELWRSTDGGASFSLVNGWAEYYGDPVNRLHADLPGLNAVWTPGGTEIHYVATDGGLYRSDDRVATVENVSLEKLHVSQYYSTHTSASDPDLILAGSQDQGYQRTNGTTVGSLHEFDQLISGDYGHLTSGDGTHAWVFSTYPGFVLVQQGETSPSLVAYLDFPPGENQSWMPYVLADPNDPDSFYFCATHLVRYRHGFGNTWTPIAGAQDFTVSGGAYTTALAISPADPDDRLTVTNTGRLWWSSDGGSAWTLSTETGPAAHYFYGTALEFSPTVVGEAYAGGSGYSGPAVWRTEDGGATWSAVGDGLPATLVYDLAYEGGASPVVYAATEAGPYRLDPATDTWESLDDASAPLTTYWSVEAVPAAGVMRFGTYGRGIWDWQIESTVPVEGWAAAGSGPELRLLNAPNPFADATTIRFTLSGRGPAELRVLDVTGRRVRELASGERGIGTHRVVWDGRDDAGRRVAAGVYFARLETDEGVAVRRITRMR